MTTLFLRGSPPCAHYTYVSEEMWSSRVTMIVGDFVHALLQGSQDLCGICLTQQCTSYCPGSDCAAADACAGPGRSFCLCKRSWSCCAVSFCLISKWTG